MNLPVIVQPAPHRPYGELSEAEKWDWHARVYAFRRVILDVPHEDRTSPCDLDGVWFDEPRVEDETRRLIAKRELGRKRRRKLVDTETIGEGRALCNRWAKQNEFVDFPAAERAGYKPSDVVKAIFSAASVRPVKGFGTLSDLAGSMGVKAREWTPEEMAKGRAALGIEPAPQSDEAAREEPPH